MGSYSSYVINYLGYNLAQENCWDSVFQNGISQNSKCAIKDGFHRDSYILGSIYSSQMPVIN